MALFTVYLVELNRVAPSRATLEDPPDVYADAVSSLCKH